LSHFLYLPIALAPRSQGGLTLLEVLIALSIFSMIGVASFQVLSVVSTTQKVTQEHSIHLGKLQKTVSMLDSDLQQLVSRDVRVSAGSTSTGNVSEYLVINTNEYAVEMTRAGWGNPLRLSRSSLQRVAYDIGPHPKANDVESVYYRDETLYLRRHYWRVLDRVEQSQRITQVLLANVEELRLAVLTDKGRFVQWPKKSTGGDDPVLKGIELTFKHQALGNLSKLYRVN
jgi:general secretion pathway protein J